MKNKEDPKVRERIHNFASLRKKGDLPLDLSYSYERSGISTLIENSDSISKNLAESSSVLYIGNSTGQVPSDFEDYDLIFTNDNVSIPNSITILNNYSDDLQGSDKKSDDVFYLGPDDSEKRSEFLIKYINKCNVYLSNQNFESHLDRFLDFHEIELSDVETLIPILFLLKSFDVVHCYRLDYESNVEDDLVFGLHFTGYITLKDLYE